MKELLEKLPGALLCWYQENKRELPWRADTQPYHVWLSEIMLQQTRVEAVKGYYARFLDALPAVADLANCEDDALHKLWEGLGYYSRVRNLKKAAQVVMERYGGEFPGEYNEVLGLPGIGEYTAGAICSICFGLKTPAVDGNVLRVISRITDDSTPIDLPAYKKKVTAALAEIYPDKTGDFTQALMELGATVCGPNRKPDCHRCPCQDFCLGAKRGTAENLPVKLPKRGRRQEEMTVFICVCDGKYATQKRESRGLLADLWQFPNVPGNLEVQQAVDAAGKLGLQVTQVRLSLDKTHIFTHVQWNMRGFYLETAECTGDFRWFTAEEIEREIALPTAFRQFWESRQK